MAGPASYRVAELDSPAARARLLEAKARQGLRTVLIVPAYNERGNIERVVADCPRDLVDEILVMDDGSTDGSMERAAALGARVLSVEQRQGIGAAIRRGLHAAAAEGFQVAIIIAGNGKDDPRQAARLLQPIIVDGADYVQGSRYLPGGEFGAMPFHRKVVTRVYPWLVRLATGRRVTDGTNGFRAYRLGILADAGMDIDQDWLAECLEYYIAVKVYRSRLKVAEVPVTKLYPQGAAYHAYTKVRRSKMHHRLKPLFYLTLGLRH